MVDRGGKHRRGGLSTAHRYLEKVRPVVEQIAQWPEVKVVRGGRISAKRTSTKVPELRIQSIVTGSVKCAMKTPSGIQEFFVTPVEGASVDRLRERLGLLYDELAN